MLARPLPVALGESEPLKHLADFGRHLVAAAVAEGLLQLGVALQILVAVMLGDLPLEASQLRLHRHQFAQRRVNLVEQGPPLMLEPFLRQVADGGALGDLHPSVVDVDLPGKQPQQCRLAGAILAAQADAIAGADVPIDPPEHRLSGEILFDVS